MYKKLKFSSMSDFFFIMNWLYAVGLYLPLRIIILKLSIVMVTEYYFHLEARNLLDK